MPLNHYPAIYSQNLFSHLCSATGLPILDLNNCTPLLVRASPKMCMYEGSYDVERNNDSTLVDEQPCRLGLGPTGVRAFF